MKSPLLQLSNAIIERLKSQTSYKVFNDLPEKEEFPYIVVGEFSSLDRSDKFKPGQEVFSTIHLWSQYRGGKEISEMIDSVLRALSSSPLSLGTEFQVVFDRMDSINLIIDIDGVTRHGILRMKYFIEEV